jgi:urea transporter
MNYILSFLNSFSQVFLIENKFFGLLILIAITIIQPRLGLLSALGVLVGILFAKLIGQDASLINAGVFGFNAALIGIVCGMFLTKNSPAILITAIACVIAVLFQVAAQKYFKLSVFTLPFAFIAVLIFVAKTHLKWIE